MKRRGLDGLADRSRARRPHLARQALERGAAPVGDVRAGIVGGEEGRVVVGVARQQRRDPARQTRMPGQRAVLGARQDEPRTQLRPDQRHQRTRRHQGGNCSCHHRHLRASFSVIPSEAARRAAQSRDLVIAARAPEQVPPLRSASLRSGRDDGGIVIRLVEASPLGTIPVIPSEAARRAAQSRDLVMLPAAPEEVPPLRCAPVGMTGSISPSVAP